MTGHLAAAVSRLIAVEIDGRIVDDLNARLAPSGVTVLHEDFLDIPLKELSKRHGRKLRIVGNIPYHLTSSILFRVFDEHDAVQDLTVMVQREVAQRIIAGPGTKAYGILSVLSQFYGLPEKLFLVPPTCFHPKPKVTSAVVRIALNGKLRHDVDTEQFRVVVKTAFGKRRKTLRNSLKYLPYDMEAVQKIARAMDLPMKKRAEELSVEDFVDLTKQIEGITS